MHNSVHECSQSVQERLGRALSVVVPVVCDMVKGGAPDTHGMLLSLQDQLPGMLETSGGLASPGLSCTSLSADSTLLTKCATAYKALRGIQAGKSKGLCMQLLSLLVHDIPDKILKELLACKKAQIEAAKFHAIMVFPGGPVQKRDALCRARTPTALLKLTAAFIVRPDNTWVATADRKNSDKRTMLTSTISLRNLYEKFCSEYLAKDGGALLSYSTFRTMIGKNTIVERTVEQSACTCCTEDGYYSRDGIKKAADETLFLASKHTLMTPTDIAFLTRDWMKQLDLLRDFEMNRFMKGCLSSGQTVQDVPTHSFGYALSHPLILQACDAGSVKSGAFAKSSRAFPLASYPECVGTCEIDNTKCLKCNKRPQDTNANVVTCVTCKCKAHTTCVLFGGATRQHAARDFVCKKCEQRRRCRLQPVHLPFRSMVFTSIHLRK